jgi:hypothetical protein
MKERMCVYARILAPFAQHCKNILFLDYDLQIMLTLRHEEISVCFSAQYGLHAGVSGMHPVLAATGLKENRTGSHA